MLFYGYTTCCLADIAMAMNVFSACKARTFMSHKKEIEEPLDTELAKDMELDEVPKPTRKVSNPSVPVPDCAEPSTHDRIKGRHTIK